MEARNRRENAGQRPFSAGGRLTAADRDSPTFAVASGTTVVRNRFPAPWTIGTLTKMTRLDRITTDPAICHGKPTVRGLRYPVEMLLELLASGMSIEDVLEDYADLERDDLLAALEFGALTSGNRVTPLGAA